MIVLKSYSDFLVENKNINEFIWEGVNEYLMTGGNISEGFWKNIANKVGDVGKGVVNFVKKAIRNVGLIIKEGIELVKKGMSFAIGFGENVADKVTEGVKKIGFKYTESIRNYPKELMRTEIRNFRESIDYLFKNLLPSQMKKDSGDAEKMLKKSVDSGEIELVSQVIESFKKSVDFTKLYENEGSQIEKEIVDKKKSWIGKLGGVVGVLQIIVSGIMVVVDKIVASIANKGLESFSEIVFYFGGPGKFEFKVFGAVFATIAGIAFDLSTKLCQLDGVKAVKDIIEMTSLYELGVNQIPGISTVASLAGTLFGVYALFEEISEMS